MKKSHNKIVGDDMGYLLSFIKNINFVYVILFISLFIASFLYLYINNKKRFITSFIVIYVFFTVMSFSYFNSLFNSVFSYDYSSIRVYLIVLIITNLIAIFTVNFKVNIVNKVFNYILLISSSIIFFINLFIFLAYNFDIVDIDVNRMIFFIDLDIIIFALYIIISCVSYIGRIIYIEVKNYIRRVKYDNRLSNDLVLDNKEEVVVNNDIKDSNVIIDNNKFIIDGKDCSFIFNDPNRENVIRNYYILLTDVNARLVNGYTVDENIRIINILNRLNIKDINNVDLMNMEILGKISIDEYNLLKGYLENCKFN